MRARPLLLLLPVALVLWLRTSAPGAPAVPSAERPLLLAHYMPWFEAAPDHKSWGWHWTMNHYHPDHTTDGKLEAASHYRSLLGLYDSDDPDVLECHVLLMKLSGIGGVAIDWSGTDDYLDYAHNHRCTQHLIEFVKRAGLRYSIVYEDQTVPGLIGAHKITQAEAVEHGRKTLQWVQEHWFSDPAYVKQEGRPVFLVFGNGYYQGDQWTQIFAGLPQEPRLFTEAQVRAPAVGAFDWPHPKDGTDPALKAAQEFCRPGQGPSSFIPAAFPRFHDIYAEAGVQPSWGKIEDREGKTYEETLQEAVKSGAGLIQLSTWNDWGEGTQIEPSVEFGYRDLEVTQRESARLAGAEFPYTPEDLRLPVQLYHLRKRAGNEPALRAPVEVASQALFAGSVKKARKLLAAAQQ